MKEVIIKQIHTKNKGITMALDNIIIFIFGAIFGALILFFTLSFFRESSLKNIFKDVSFFGTTIKSDIVEVKQDLKLYQDGKEIGTLYKGVKLEKTLHVDKIDHYALNLIFEPFSYENVNEIIEEDKEIEDFSVTDMIYMGK